MKLRLPIILANYLAYAFCAHASGTIQADSVGDINGLLDGSYSTIEIADFLELVELSNTGVGVNDEKQTGSFSNINIGSNYGYAIKIVGTSPTATFGEDEHEHGDHTNKTTRTLFNANTNRTEIQGITFKHNFTTGSNDTKGAAIFNAGKDLLISQSAFVSNHINAESNSNSYSYGGAIFNGYSQEDNYLPGTAVSPGVYAKLTVQGTSFTDNSIDQIYSGNSSQPCNAAGGAIINNAFAELQGTNLQFTGNYVSSTATITGKSIAAGGAIENTGKFSISHSVFQNNGAINATPQGLATGLADAFGGAIAHTGRQVNSYWLGVDADETVVIDNCTFIGNYAQGNGDNYGGAIYHLNTSRVGRTIYTTTIANSTFTDNTTSSGSSSKGAAIYHAGTGNINFLSTNRDTTFRGNFINADLASQKRANSIYFGGGYNISGAGYDTNPDNPMEVLWINMDFRALHTYDADSPIDGSSIAFYDPADFQQSSWTLFNFNRTDGSNQEYAGRILFTGIDYQGDDAQSIASRTSTANEYTNFVQHNGLVQITDKAVVGAKEAKTNDEGNFEIGARNYTLNKGVLDVTNGGQLLSKNIITNGLGGNNYKTSIINVMDPTGTLTADHMDISRGVTFDFSGKIQYGVASKHTVSGIQLTANTVTLGGNMGIVDNLLDFYMNPTFAYDQNFLVFKGIDDSTNYVGQFDAVVSSQHDKSDLSDEFYAGRWTYEVVINEDGTKDLFASWVTGNGEQPEPGPGPGPGPGPDPGPVPPAPDSKELKPELAGSNVENSKWSTASSMQSVSNIALGQLGIDRFRLKNCTNYWMTTIGDFDSHRTDGRRAGYDYDGFGYAVGGDARFCPDNFVLGAAFGNLFGKNNSREFASRIDQTSYIGLIYWGWLKEKNENNAFNLSGTLSYGITNNRMKTYYSDGLRSQGRWDNQAMRYTLKGEWIHNLGNDWTLTPFIGLEYDDVTSKAFTETGDRPRHFAKGKLRNLALPVGTAIAKQHTFKNGYVLINSFSAAYLPDVYRKNPTSTATRQTEDGYSWTARGVAQARNAGRFEYNTRLVFNPTWSIFAGYTLETRKNAISQQASLGVSAAF